MKERLSLVFVSRKDLLKKIKVERGSDTFYSEVTDKFAKKKRKNELIYK